MQIKIEEIKKLAVTALEKRGLSKEQAEIITEDHLDGELRGRQCHGFASFPKFCINKLKIPIPNYKIIKEQENFILVDGNESMGEIVLDDVLPKIIDKSKKNGIGMLGLYNMHSYRMPGTYARKIADQDMIGLICNYGGNPRIAPEGSIDPIFATNPIAAGFPTKNNPIVVDMATSKIAMGKVRLAKKLDKQLEEGNAIDKDGNPTINPTEAMLGAMLPFGGYKGGNMALIVEILSRCLFNIPLDQEIKGKRGFMFIIIDPSKFTTIENFKERNTELVQKIKNSRKAEGVDEIFLPGEQSERIKEENIKKGYLEIDDKIVEEIKELVD